MDFVALLSIIKYKLLQLLNLDMIKRWHKIE